MNKTEKIVALDKDNPALTNRQIADVVGCSRRLVRMIRGSTEANVDGSMPKILLYDIETAPLEVYVWRLWKNVVAPHQIIKPMSMLSWSAKWLFDDKVHSARVSAKQAFNRDDSSILKQLWDLLEEADMIIAHNGAKFDVRRINARFALNGMLPTTPYRIIDTLVSTKRQFGLSAYKLDYVNYLFGLSQKSHPGFAKWRAAVENSTESEEALETIRRYCNNDVRILEELYVQIRPWIRSHPNMGLYVNTDGRACTNCGSKDLDWGGKYHTPAGRFLAFRCENCGAIGRSRTSDISKEERKTVCVGTV